MSDSPKIIYVDTNKDGDYENGEIITIASSSGQKSRAKEQETASDLLGKRMKIRPEKERIIDKSYEL